MSYSFRPAKRADVLLLLGFAGGTGSGKTYSALRVARGLAGGGVFAGIDTENGRMEHYAEAFPELRVTQIKAPFRPDAYTEAIEAGVAFLKAENVPLANRVVLVDSASHEWYGDGGCLDWHDELMGGQESKNLSAWIKPKKAHKHFVTRLLQLEAHVILCFRAEPKVEAVRKNGKLEIVPKATVTGLDGWIPISEKNLPYELTASFLLMADQPGIPKPIKLQEQHKPFVPLDRVIDETVGKRLGEWAAGSSAEGVVDVPTGDAGRVRSDAPSADVLAAIEQTRDRLVKVADELGVRAATEEAIGRNRAEHHADLSKHAAWLKRQLKTAEKNLEQRRAPAVAEGDAVEPAGVPAAGEHGDDSSAPSANAEQPSLYDQIASKATERGAA